MQLFHKIMNRLGRYRLIPDRRTGEDYMHRYYIFLKDRKWFPFNVTLHKIVRSDDPIMHDHPWPYLTVVLKGGYHEHVLLKNKSGDIIGETIKWRGPGSIVRRRANEFHWLELDHQRPATTLFFMGPQQRDWGFLVHTRTNKYRWVKHQYFLDNWKYYHDRYIKSKQESANV